jgi:hypothetical protein
MFFLKAVWKDGYEEKYAIPGTRFYWLQNGTWTRGSTIWDDMRANIDALGDRVKLVEWVPTPKEMEKLESF